MKKKPVAVVPDSLSSSEVRLIGYVRRMTARRAASVLRLAEKFSDMPEGEQEAVTSESRPALRLVVNNDQGGTDH